MSDPIVSAGGATGGVILPALQLSPGAPGQKVAKGDPGGIAISTPTASPQAAVSQGGQPSASHPVSAAAAVDTAITQIREFLKNLPPEIQFSEDKSSGHVVFKVVNPVTHEVVRQFPPEEILAMARRLKALQDGGTGLLIDQET
jgi:flagellar protein FlaG